MDGDAELTVRDQDYYSSELFKQREREARYRLAQVHAGTTRRERRRSVGRYAFIRRLNNRVFVARPATAYRHARPERRPSVVARRRRPSKRGDPPQPEPDEPDLARPNVRRVAEQRSMDRDRVAA